MSVQRRAGEGGGADLSTPESTTQERHTRFRAIRLICINREQTYRKMFFFQNGQEGDIYCKDTIPKIRNKYSQERNCAGISLNFHIHVTVSDLYIPTIDLPIYSDAGKYVDRSWEYINHSKTHECGNWD